MLLHTPARPRRHGALRLALLTVCLIACGVFAAGQALDLVEPASPLRTDGLALLANGQAGRALHVPDEPGFSPRALDAAEWLALRGTESGASQRICLAEQVREGADLYPLSITAGLQPRMGVRNPLVLAPQLAPGLPQGLRLTGQWRRGDLPRIAIRWDRATPPGATWDLALAPSRTADAATLLDEAWLLWQPQSSASPATYRHALRLRLQPHARCGGEAAGWSIEAQLFQAERSDFLVQVLVRRDPAHPLHAVWLPPGVHTIPATPPLPQEDREAFDRWLAEGRLVPLPDRRLAVKWMAQHAAGAADGAHDALWIGNLGQLVRAEIRRANSVQHLLAVRVQGMPADADRVPQGWRASSGGQLQRMSVGVPDVAARLFDELPAGYGPWLRLQPLDDWSLPDAGQVAVPHGASLLELPVSPEGTPLELLVLGRVVGWEGAQRLVRRDACTGPACRDTGGETTPVVERVTIWPRAGVRRVSLQLAPTPGLGRLRLAEAQALSVRWTAEGQPSWRPRPATRVADAPAQVVVQAAGEPVDQGLAGARALLGTAGHPGRLQDMLSGLGRHGMPQVKVELTLDVHYQRLASQVLNCRVQQHGTWDPQAQRCRPPASAAAAPTSPQHASFVLLAPDGHILAAAMNEPPLSDAAFAEARASYRFTGPRSPMAWRPWQSWGQVDEAPGSSLKIALATWLAQQARAGDARARFLVQRHTPAAWDAWARSQGLPFRFSSACYPGCEQAHLKPVRNFGNKPPQVGADGLFGLKEAIEHSVNTYFVLTIEALDDLQRKAPTARALGAHALTAERPLLALWEALSLDRPMKLDCGLLPADFAWKDDDPLMASLGLLQNAGDIHRVRRQAIGLLLSLTPLQMARIALWVATGAQPQPCLLKRLNDKTPAPVADVAKLPDELLRSIREGMAAVVTTGTAAGAFAGPELEGVRAFIGAKTGTAQLQDTVDCQRGGRDGTQCRKTAWVIGFLRPGAIPHENRTLAFAVQLTPTEGEQGTGGGAAAPIVADFLRALQPPREAAAAAERGASGRERRPGKEQASQS